MLKFLISELFKSLDLSGLLTTQFKYIYLSGKFFGHIFSMCFCYNAFTFVRIYDIEQ